VPGIREQGQGARHERDDHFADHERCHQEQRRPQVAPIAIRAHGVCVAAVPGLTDVLVGR
jgi:hypothetical protein